MDELTFHRELVSLKQQVASMSIADQDCHYSPSNLEYAHNEFMRDIEELRTHTASLESRLQKRWSAVHPIEDPSSSRDHPPLSDPAIPVIEPIGTLSPKYGPEFYTLFHGLQEAMIELNHRVRDVARAVSDFEGRSDGLDVTLSSPVLDEDGGIPDRGAIEIQIKEITRLEQYLKSAREDLQRRQADVAEKGDRNPKPCSELLYVM